MINKTITFCILVFLVFYIFSKSGNYISVHLNINLDIILLLLAAVFTGVIYLLKKMNDNGEGFHFELTPEKKCDGGPYMYSSDPERQKLCSQFSPEDLSKYECCPGFHGRPVWWNRDSESNDNWSNQMCNGNFKDFSDPHVL
jgi:hypothetical protein